MKTSPLLLVLVALALLTGNAAEAAFSCSVTSTGIATAYDPLATADRVTQSSATIQCNRDSGDAQQLIFTLAASNGQNASGQGNRAKLGTQLLAYDLFQDYCSTRWRSPGGGYFERTLNFAGSLSAAMTLDYWACIPRSQTGLAAGTYTDQVTMTLTYYGAGKPQPPSQVATGTFGVNISTPWQCSISTTPGILDFGAYLAFGPALSASTTFGVTCTNSLPYTVAVSPTSGVVTGLNYSVAPALTTNTGTGVQQILTINGSMPAGQAGTCAGASCSGSNVHTVTLTY